MVRLSLILLSSLLLPYLCFSQEEYDPYTNYLSVETTVSASFAGVGVVPTFSVYRNRHKIDIGVNVKAFDVWQDGPGILGSYLSYKYFPSERKATFNLYFGYHNLFSTHNKSKKFPELVIVGTDEVLLTDKVYLLENMVGIGFDLQLGNQFYAFNDYSVGVVIDWETFKRSDTRFDIRPTGQIRVGFGYNLGWRKAK